MFGAINISELTQILMVISAIITPIIAPIGIYMLTKLSGHQKAMYAASERAEQREENIAKRVHEVAMARAVSDKAAQEKLDKIENTTSLVLTHVNDQTTVQLRRYAESMEEIANLAKTDSAREKADTARKEYEEHKLMQEKAKETKSTPLAEPPAPVSEHSASS